MSYFGYGTPEQDILDAVDMAKSVHKLNDTQAAKAAARVLEYLVGSLPDTDE
jgi:hypothetical protein